MDYIETLLCLISIIIVKNIIKLEILENWGDFKKLFENFKKSHFFSRDNRIDEILNNLEISKDKIYGSVYKGDQFVDELIWNKSSKDIANMSHTIEHLSYENGKYYGYIKLLDTDSGIIFKMNSKKYSIEDVLRLYPIYVIIGENSFICTFNIAWDETELINRILQRQ